VLQLQLATPSAMLLVLMPHHVPLLHTSGARLTTAHGFPSVHGFCRLAVLESSARDDAGDLSWRFRLPLVKASFHAPRPIAPSAKPALLSELARESRWLPPDNYLRGAGDPYNAGKLLARMARTALIAEALGQHAVAAAVAANLTTLVHTYAITGAENEWVYDRAWGGLISCGCDYSDCMGKCAGHCANAFPVCPSLADPGRDFGNSYYNDHHFHYGYHLYAAAVAVKLGPASVPWTVAGAQQSALQSEGARQKSREQRARLRLLLRDIASPTHTDPAFPRTRHKDWYHFVSWASGVALAGNQPYRNGRNQESASEAVNSYAAVALLGTALGDSDVSALGHALLATEVIATQTYYQAREGDGIHPPSMVSHAMVGMLWQNLAQYQTWFGSASYLVHGIQVLPITPVTEHTLKPTFVRSGQLEVFARSCEEAPACTADGWAAFVALERAIIDPMTAWDQVLALPDRVYAASSPAGNGNSRLNSLWWVATRPGAADAIGAVALPTMTLYAAVAPTKAGEATSAASSESIHGAVAGGAGGLLLLTVAVGLWHGRRRAMWLDTPLETGGAVATATAYSRFEGLDA